MSGMDGERLQKVLAQAGVASRRQIESWIEQGRILVNGQVAKLGVRVSAEDKIVIDGKSFQQTKATQKTRVILYHKPIGEICTRHDPDGRETIFDHLPRLKHGRWIAIGRLDINTSGLLLLTTNGELANRLMHPSSEVEREYAVRVLGEVKHETLKVLTQGVLLEDGKAKFESILDSGGDGANHWYHVVLHEGRNREVRRLWEAVGCTVSRLSRVRFGPVSLPRSIRPGKWQDLSPDLIFTLAQLVGVNIAKEQIYNEKAKLEKNKMYSNRPYKR